MLGKDPELKDRMPIDPKTMALFISVHDGIVLCKLINTAVAGTVDERALNLPSKLGKRFNEFHMTENQILCINSARAIGCSVVNIGPNDLLEGKPHLVMGLIWQVSFCFVLFSRQNKTVSFKFRKQTNKQTNRSSGSDCCRAST